MKNSVEDVEVTTKGVAEDSSTNANKRWWENRMLQMSLLFGVVCLGVGLGAYLGTSKESSTKSSNADAFSPEVFEESCGIKAANTSEEEPFMHTGCFQDIPSDDFHNLMCRTPNLWAEECSEKCFTRFFTVNPANQSCKCYSVPPTERLSIGSCSSLSNRRRRRRTQERQVPVELYFNLATSTSCSQTNSESVRNKLVEEDNAQFGFDIVSNEWRTSPFELFSDGCGTNMYKVSRFDYVAS